MTICEFKIRPMTYVEYIRKLGTLQNYIAKKWAITPGQLARRLDISERTILRMIRFLKSKGVQIYYCKKSKCYKINDD